MAQTATYDPTSPTPYQAPQLPPVQQPAPSPLPPPQTPDFGGTAPSKAGGVASILDNVMRGYMQGRAQARQSQAVALERKTQSSQALYNMAAQNLQQLIESYNVPPEQVQAILKNPGQKPQGMDDAVYKQLMNANSVVQQAWSNIQQLYGSQVEDQAGGKKGKGKKQNQQNPLQMITSQDPQEKVQGLYQLWSKMPPPIYGSLYQAAQNATMRAQAITTEQGTLGAQQAQNTLDQNYLNAKNEKTQIAQGTQTMVGANIKGLKESGNLPIWNRPDVQNADGSHSSEYSVSFQDPKTGYEVLVPTIVNGKFLTPDGKKPPVGSDAEKAMKAAAWQHYLQTGENLGKFDNAADADAYAQQLHNRGSREERIKQLDAAIDEYERSTTGSWKSIEYEDPNSHQRMTLSYNGKTAQWLDANQQPVAGPPSGWVVAPKPSVTKPPKVTNAPGTKRILDITDSDGTTWTPDQLARGEGGEQVQSLYRGTLAAQDAERQAAKEKSDQFYAHADYSNALQINRMITALDLKVNAADITNWKKLDDAANTNEGMYERALKQSYPAPTPTSEQALLISWVRSNVAGAGRLNTTEIQQGLRAGSYGLKAQNAWDIVTTGTLAPELHNDFVNDIRNAAQASRDEADKYKTEHNISDADLQAIADHAKKEKESTPKSKGFVDVAAAMQKPKYKGKPKDEVIKEIRDQGYTPTENGAEVK